MLVPNHVWNVVFLHGHGVWTSVENALVGPLIADRLTTIAPTYLSWDYTTILNLVFVRLFRALYRLYRNGTVGAPRVCSGSRRG